MCRTTTCSNGQTGPPGRDGRDGLPGRDCTQGLLGLNGTQGPIGPQGPPGIDGLNGTQGPIGPQGLQGIDGLDGIQGPIGPQGPVGPAGPTIGGVVYTRWGNSACPNITGTELVYTGRAGGTQHDQRGGGANYLCLPMDPEYNLPSRAGLDGHSPVWGAEYQGPVVGAHDHDVPCAVCHGTTRLTVLMIPAKASCPTSWTKEYDGYLMSEFLVHYRTMFVCVDRAQESFPGTGTDHNGALFYHAEADCTNLPCLPYNNVQELNCVVCTK